MGQLDPLDVFMAQNGATRVKESTASDPLDAFMVQNGVTIEGRDKADQSSASSGSALAASGAERIALPVVARSAAEIATNPNAAKIGSAIGRTIGGLSPIIANPLNPMSYIAAPGAAWAGGKGGWFGAKMLQSVAGPVATAAEKIAPVVEGLGYAPALQGDMTTQALGMSQSDFQKLAKLDQINLFVSKLGLSVSEATRAVNNIHAMMR